MFQYNFLSIFIAHKTALVICLKVLKQQPISLLLRNPNSIPRKQVYVHLHVEACHYCTQYAILLHTLYHPPICTARVRGRVTPQRGCAIGLYLRTVDVRCKPSVSLADC